jgi:hypothetical protein
MLNIRLAFCAILASLPRARRGRGAQGANNQLRGDNEYGQIQKGKDYIKKSPEKRRYDFNEEYIPKERWMRYLGTSVFLTLECKSLGKIAAINDSWVVIKRGSLKPIWYYFGHGIFRRLRPNPQNIRDTKDYNLGRSLFVDMSLDEAALYASTVPPDPNAYATLGVSRLAYDP